MIILLVRLRLYLIAVVAEAHHGDVVELIRLADKSVDVRAYRMQELFGLSLRIAVQSVQHPLRTLRRVDDVAGHTLVSASSVEKGFEGSGSNKEAARKVGKTIAERAVAKGIENDSANAILIKVNHYY